MILSEEREGIRMIRREDIITELVNRGYNVEEHTSIKNGVKLDGIHFMNDSGISPVVYTDEIIENSELLHEAVVKVLNAYNNADIMDFDKEKLFDVEFIMENLYIGLQKTGIEDIVKSETDFEGIEKYLYVRINENTSFKLTYGLLEKLKVSESDVWKVAENNTFSKTTIVSMAEKISELMGQEVEDLEGVPAQYIVTNTMNFRGASAILDMIALKELAQKLNVHKFIVLPSSIHEMIIIPDDDGNSNIEELSRMVQEVNETQVEPEERLTDRAYAIEV